MVGIYTPDTDKLTHHEIPTAAESVAAAQGLAHKLGMHLVMIPKTKATGNQDQVNYYHLDTFMAALPDGNLIGIPSATTPDVWKQIKTIVEKVGKEVLELPPGTSNMATNIIAVNGNVFSPVHNEQIDSFLKKHGFNYVVGGFQISDSGPHCLINVNKKNQQTPDGRTTISAADPADIDKPMTLAGLKQLGALEAFHEQPIVTAHPRPQLEIDTSQKVKSEKHLRHNSSMTIGSG